MHVLCDNGCGEVAEVRSRLACRPDKGPGDQFSTQHFSQKARKRDSNFSRPGHSMSTRSSKRKFSPILDSTPIPKKVKSRAPPPRARTLEPDVLSVNELKSRIRDLKRLLRDPERLPADARIEKERALIGYESDLANAQARKERAGMIKKYHFVRFLGTWYQSC